MGFFPFHHSSKISSISRNDHCLGLKFAVDCVYDIPIKHPLESSTMVLVIDDGLIPPANVLVRTVVLQESPAASREVAG